MSDLVPITIYLSFIILLIGTITSQHWWGFWTPDRRAKRRYERNLRKRVASLIDLGVAPEVAKQTVLEQVKQETREALLIQRELVP